MTLDSLPIAEPALRLGLFAGVLASMALWEVVAPRRLQSAHRNVRWTSNLGLVALDTALVRLVFPITAVGLAVMAESRGWGLLNMLGAPGWLAVLLSVIALDFVIYWQHVWFHRIPVLWRLHRMHHTDVALDVTSGTRFHPLEIMISMLLKLAVVAGLGAPALAVLIFEVLLNATAMFNHANAFIPPAIDKRLRWMVVTPDMHRVHHSVVPTETDSNFGFNLPWWDRLFGTYRAQPKAGHDAMTIGLTEFRSPVDQRIDRLLVQPFRSGAKRTT